jgi:hypothetical protein
MLTLLWRASVEWSGKDVNGLMRQEINMLWTPYQTFYIGNLYFPKDRSMGDCDPISPTEKKPIDHRNGAMDEVTVLGLLALANG